MPVIREYQSQVAPEGIVRTAASPEDFGAGIGQALSGVGRGLGDIATGIHEADAKRKRDADALDKATERVNADIAVKEMIVASSALDKQQLDEIAANPNDEETIRKNYNIQRDQFVNDYKSQLKFDENKLFVTASMAEASAQMAAQRANDVAEQKTTEMMDALARQGNVAEKVVHANPFKWQSEVNSFNELVDSIRSAMPELNAKGKKMFADLKANRREQLMFVAGESLIISNPQAANYILNGIESINMDVPFGKRVVKMQDGTDVTFNMSGTIADVLKEGGEFSRGMGKELGEDALQWVKADIIEQERKRQFKPMAGLEWFGELTLENQNKLRTLAKVEANANRAVAVDTLRLATEDEVTAAEHGEKSKPVTLDMFRAAIPNNELAGRRFAEHQIQVKAAGIAYGSRLLSPEDAANSINLITQSVTGLGEGAATKLRDQVLASYIKMREEGQKDPVAFGVGSKKIAPLNGYGVEDFTRRAHEVTAFNSVTKMESGILDKKEADSWKELFSKANTAEQLNMLTTLSSAMKGAKVSASIRNRTIAQVGVDFQMQTSLALMGDGQTETALAILKGRQYIVPALDPSGNKVSLPAGAMESETSYKKAFDKYMLGTFPMTSTEAASSWSSVYAYILGNDGPQKMMSKDDGDKEALVKSAVKAVFGDNFEHNGKMVFVPFGVRADMGQSSIEAGYGNMVRNNPALPGLGEVVFKNEENNIVSVYDALTGDPVYGSDKKPVYLSFGKVIGYEKATKAGEQAAKQAKQKEFEKADDSVRIESVVSFEDAMRAEVKSPALIRRAINNAAIHERWYRKNNENGQYNRILDAIKNPNKYTEGSLR